ncbi:MAG: potassium/hydrogen antiporter [Thermoplasmata archaeon]|nr:potassium/hydrogen antiporter [Thermoplasmata archaeon]
MALDAATVLATVGLVAVAAVAAAAAFRRTRVPDVLLLIAFGILAGPGLRLVPATLFRTLAPVASIAAVLVILFDGGLDVQVRELRRGAGPASAVALLAFALTTLLATAAAMLLLGLALPLAVLLGMSFGGAGVAVVIPLIQAMEVSRDARTVVSLGAAIADVLLVVGVFSLAAALAQHEASLPLLAFRLVASFVVAAAVGLLVGLLWLRLLDAHWSAGHESLATVGALFLVYAASETLHGSGPLAVLVFALVIGNSRHAATFTSTALGTAGPPTFHRQAALAIRAFVFVGLGATLDVRAALQPRLLLFALAACIAVVGARVLAVWVAARRILPARWDRLAVTLMFPLGLPTAAASLIPAARFGLEGTQQFPQIAAVVILLTIVASGALVTAVLQPGLRRRLEGHAGAGR